MTKFNNIFQRLKRLTIFDWFVILVVLFGLVFLILFILKEERWVKVEVKISPKEWWRDSKGPPYWLGNLIREGDKQYDLLGRKTAEILEVKNYEWKMDRNFIYLTLNLKAEVDKRRKKLKFDHQPLEVGGQIDLQLGNIGMPGLVTYIEGMLDTRIWEEKIVETRVLDYIDIFPETLGVQPWKAEAINVGDQMKNTHGQVVAEILDKKIKPAEKITTTADGRIILGQDPIKKDVALVIKIKTFKQEGVDYFLDDIKIKIGESLFLSLPKVDIYPTITEILQ